MRLGSYLSPQQVFLKCKTFCVKIVLMRNLRGRYENKKSVGVIVGVFFSE